jgi:quercetin dioxygenase-like cupin family protein
MLRIWSVAALLCLAGSFALAQDFAKVAPNVAKVEIDNPDVRVLRVRYKPHEKTAMHSHPDVVIVFLTDSHTMHTFPDGKTEESRAKAGQAIWRPNLEHSVENLSDQPFEVIEIELKGKMSGPAVADNVEDAPGEMGEATRQR